MTLSRTQSAIAANNIVHLPEVAPSTCAQHDIVSPKNPSPMYSDPYQLFIKHLLYAKLSPTVLEMKLPNRKMVL